MTGSILKFHYHKGLCYLVLGIAVPWVLAVTLLFLVDPDNLKYVTGRKTGFVGDAVQSGSGFGTFLTYVIPAMMVWFSYYLIRQTVGLFTRLKGGDVPAVAFGIDEVELNTAFGQYRLKRKDIKKIKTRWAVWTSFLFIYLDKGCEYRNILGLRLRKIEIMLPLKGVSKKQLAAAISRWQQLEMPEIAESAIPAQKPAYGVAMPEKETSSVWSRPEPSVAETSQQRPVDMPSESAVVRPHRSRKPVFGRRNVTART